MIETFARPLCFPRHFLSSNLLTYDVPSNGHTRYIVVYPYILNVNGELVGNAASFGQLLSHSRYSIDFPLIQQLFRGLFDQHGCHETNLLGGKRRSCRNSFLGRIRWGLMGQQFFGRPLVELQQAAPAECLIRREHGVEVMS